MADRPDELAAFGECVCGDGRGWSQPTADRNPVKYCRRCDHLRHLRRYGGVAHTWEAWRTVPELEEQRATVVAWPGGAVSWSLLLHAGATNDNLGTGKSFVLAALGHAWIDRGVRVRYLVIPEVLDQIRASFDDESAPAPDLGGFPGLLLLDELGAERLTPWVGEVLDRALGLRYRRRLSTAIATNLSLAGLEARYPRIVDRLYEGTLIRWVAASWRRR